MVSIPSLVFAIAAGALPKTIDYGVALAALDDYSAAINRNDCANVLRLTSAQVLEPFKDGTHADMCGMLDDMHASGLVDRVGFPVGAAQDGSGNAMIVVAATRTMNNEAGVSVFDMNYVVHTSDRGATWQVLDQSCADMWVREVYPAYSGTPVIRPMTPRPTH